MTQREETDSPPRAWERVDLAPAARGIDVTAHCGPRGDEVMVNLYREGHTMFLSPKEAFELAGALQRGAERTMTPR